MLLLPILLPGPDARARKKEHREGLHRTQRRRWYAVIYEGLDPVTGREIRRWHPAGTTKEQAEKLARRLAREANGPDDGSRSLSFGAYLTHTWLPAKRLELKTSTWDGYRRNVDRHILPALAAVPIRRLRVAHPRGPLRDEAPTD